MEWKDHLRAFEKMRDSTHAASQPKRYAQGGHIASGSGLSRRRAKSLAAQGRGGDTKLAEMGPRTVRMMDELIHGGRRQVNPKTGLREYATCNQGIEGCSYTGKRDHICKLISSDIPDSPKNKLKTPIKCSEPECMSDNGHSGNHSYPINNLRNNRNISMERQFHPDCVIHAGNNLRKIMNELGQYDPNRNTRYEKHLERTNDQTRNNIKFIPTPQAKSYGMMLSNEGINDKLELPVNVNNKLGFGSFLGPNLNRDAYDYEKKAFKDLNSSSRERENFRKRPTGIESNYVDYSPNPNRKSIAKFGPNRSSVAGHGFVTNIRPYENPDQNQKIKYVKNKNDPGDNRSRHGSLDIWDSNMGESPTKYGEHAYYDRNGNVFVGGDIHPRFSLKHSTLYRINPEESLKNQKAQMEKLYPKNIYGYPDVDFPALTGKISAFGNKEKEKEKEKPK